MAAPVGTRMIITQSQVRPVQAPLVFARSTQGQPAPEQLQAKIKVQWPERDAYGRVHMREIDPAQIPRGWQSVQVHVPMRLATCEETECPNLLRGWTEVLPLSGGTHAREGAVSSDEAARMFGYYGEHSLPPAVIHHPAGTPCPEVHKVPSGIPPLLTVDGRWVLINEFEDRLGGGIHQTGKIRREGHY